MTSSLLAPVSQNFSGTVKADGTLAIPIQAQFASNWAMVMATVRQLGMINSVLTPVGNPYWTFEIGADVSTFDNGSSVQLGPRLIPPKANITIRLINGTPGAQVNGLLHGSFTDRQSPLELIQGGAYAPIPNSLSAIVSPVASPFFATEIIPPLGTPVRTYQLPVGSNAISFTITPTGSNTAISYTVTGKATGFVYGSVQTPDITGGKPIIVNIWNPADLLMPIQVVYNMGATGTGQTVQVAALNVPIISALPESTINNVTINTGVVTSGSSVQVLGPAPLNESYQFWNAEINIITGPGGTGNVELVESINGTAFATWIGSIGEHATRFGNGWITPLNPITGVGAAINFFNNSGGSVTVIGSMKYSGPLVYPGT